jgi:hypothetical protein
MLYQPIGAGRLSAPITGNDFLLCHLPSAIGDRRRAQALGTSMKKLKKQPYHQPLLTRHKVPRAVSAKAASECALMLVCSDAPAQDVQLTVTKVGTNLVLSWPASATNAVLESSSCLTTGWTAVTASPVTYDQTVKVTLPLAGPQQFFRLKTCEKDPSADKDPNSDKISEKGGT